MNSEIDCRQCGPEITSELVSYFYDNDDRRDANSRKALAKLIERDHYRVVQINHRINIGPMFVKQMNEYATSDRESAAHTALKYALADFLDSLGHRIKTIPADDMFMHPNHPYPAKMEVHSPSNFEDRQAPSGIADVSCGCPGCEIYGEVGYSKLRKVRNGNLQSTTDCYITAAYEANESPERGRCEFTFYAIFSPGESVGFEEVIRPKDAPLDYRAKMLDSQHAKSAREYADQLEKRVKESISNENRE